MTGLQENVKNFKFWAFWVKKANFGQILAKMGKTEFFFKQARDAGSPDLSQLNLIFWFLTGLRGIRRD